MSGSMADIQSATAEIRRGKKIEDRRNHRAKISRSALFHRATIKIERKREQQLQNIIPALLGGHNERSRGYSANRAWPDVVYCFRDGLLEARGATNALFIAARLVCFIPSSS